MPATLRDLPAAPRVLVLTGPLFAPTALAGAFAVAYQDALGLSPQAIGLLAAAATGLGFLFLGLGTVASERWGRLRALTLFDVVGFVLPFALFALARTPAEVAAAALLGATSQGAQAGFQGLLLADLREGQRQRVLGMEHLLLTLPSVAMPLAAAGLVAAWGMVPAVRACYLLAAASVALMVAVRWVALRRAGPAGRDLLDAPRPAWRLTFAGLREAGLAPVLAGAGVLAFAGGLGALAQVRVLQVVGLDAWWLGPFAFAGVAVDLVATAAGMRRGARALAVGGALAGAGSAALFLAAQGPVLVLASGAAAGLAGAWAGLGTGALLHDAVPEGLRERAASALVGARTLGGLAGAALAGALYAQQDTWPWVGSALAFLLGAAVLARRQG